METKFSFNNFRIINKKKKEHSYYNKLIDRSNKNFKKLFEEFKKYTIPIFYVSDLNRIKKFNEIKSNFELLESKYFLLKKIFELNKDIFKIPSTNLNLKCAKEDNIIFKHLDFNKCVDYNYLLNNNQIFKNIKEYQRHNNIYTKHSTNLFLKIINNKIKNKNRTQFIKIYQEFNNYNRKIITYPYFLGILSYRELFHIDNGIEDETNENKKENIYELLKGNIQKENENNINVNNINENILTQKMEKLDNVIANYTDLYNPYDISESTIKSKKKIEENLVKFHNISLQLSQENYTNVYDLLILLLDQQYYLLSFLLYFTNMKKLQNIYQKDVNIRKLIKRNIMLFDSYKDQYFYSLEYNNSTSSFKIPGYNPSKFFQEQPSGINFLEPSLTGIQNLGSTCYLNASLQMLYSMNYFRKEILDLNITDNNQVIKALKNMFVLMNNKNTSEDKIEIYIKILVKFMGSEIGKQQDSEEFINKLLNNFDNINNIKNLYEIKEKSIRYCSNNQLNNLNFEQIVNKMQKKNHYNIDEHFFKILSLPIDSTNIQDMITNYQLTEELKGDHRVHECGKDLKTFKKIELIIPDSNMYIIIQLRRFKLVYDKKGNPISKKIDNPIGINQEIEINKKIYILIGSIIHHGQTTDSGHYVYQTFNDDGTVGYLYDDSKVKNEIDIEFNKNCYILLYKRKGI